MNLWLKRVGADRNATYGVLIAENVPFTVTLEDPWLNNERDISCIPTGMYLCRRTASPKFGDTFEITGVKGREHILFHWGNTAADTKGCILIGEGFDKVNGVNGIVSSRRGFSEFMAMQKNTDAFTLNILYS